MKSAIVALTLCVAASAAFASGKESGQGGKVDWFAKQKEMKLESMRGRLAIMQQSISCVQSASSPEAFHSCEKSERVAMEDHQTRMKARWDSQKPR